jgi:hypothetical protein
VYAGIFAGVALLGYREMAPERLIHLGSIPLGCVFTFLLTSAGYLLALRYAASQCAKFPRPSWNRRFPLVEWRYDPLQFLLFLMLIALGLLVESLSRLPGSGANGLSIVIFLSSLLLGESTGLVIGCVIHRRHVRTI